MKDSQEKRMATAAAIVMSSIVLSRITGFIRESTLSWKVGLNWVQDAYVAAFTVPDLMYNLLVGGAISAALIPFLSGYLEKGEEKEGWKATSTFINTVLISMVLLSILGIVFAPYFIPLVAHGFAKNSPQTNELAITLTRILFTSVSFIILAGVCNGILNSYRKFAAAAYGPTVYNIGCILSILIFADVNPESMKKVAIGVACSAAVYFIFQLSFTFKNLKLYQFIIDLKDKGFRSLVKQAVPSILSSSIVQLNVIISISFVSLSLAEGSVAAFKNANTAWQLPYGIFAMGIGTAMLPTLSRKFVMGELDEYKNILIKSLNSVLFLTIPSAVGFIVLGEPIVRAFFKWGGKFTEYNVPTVAGILAVFSVAMITQSIVATMNRAFYARHDTKTPLIIGMCSMILNFCLGYLFYKTTKLGASGMALSYSIISTINSILLIILLNKKNNGINPDKFFKFILKAVPASLAMGVALWVMEKVHLRLVTKAAQLLYLVMEVAAGVLIYFTVMLLFKSDEAIYSMKIVSAKLKNVIRIKSEET